MKKSEGDFFVVRHYCVNCKPNDRVDISCGGPGVLGFDFYIDVDEDVEKMKKWLENEIKKNDLPLMGILVEEITDDKNPWTKKMMSKCIKEYVL